MEYAALSLNYNDFKSVFVDLFAQDKSLNGALWGVSYGNADQFTFSNGGLTLTGSAAEGWNPVGFLQAPTGKSAGEGYGLFQFTGYVNPGQGIGVGFVMWRADNMLVDPTTPDKATEIDILESWDKSKTGESTIHFYNSGWAADNGQEYNSFKIDLTVPHTYAMDWERGSLTFYVDGNEIYQDTVHAPLDYADGGSNEVMGAEIVNEKSLVTTPTVQLHITEMEYSAPVNTTASTTTTMPSVVTLGGGAQNYSAAAGVTVQAGSGNDTIHATAGAVTVLGGSGQLTFFGGTLGSQATGGTGSAALFGGAGGGSYTGGSLGGNVLVSQGASGSNTTLTGGGAGDALFGSASGNDTMIAAKGRESVVGGGGNTQIFGGGTAGSVIFTGSGTTQVAGGVAGGDTVVGGSGSLSLTAQNGDAVFGGSGALNVTGSTSAADSIIGGAGALSVNGLGANMLVVTSMSTSNIQTGNGAALIFGTSGSATVGSGTGWMEIIQGSGNLTVNQGSGPATYALIKGVASGTDMVTGFNPSIDKIDLFNYQPSDVNVATSGGSTTLTLAGGAQIHLIGVTDMGSSIV